jgi:serine protease Do
MSRAKMLPASVLLLSAGVLAACNDGGTAIAQQRAPSQEVQQQLGDLPAVLDTASAAGLSTAFRGAASIALPAVVQIRVVAQREGQRGGNPFRFPGFNEDQPRRAEGTGSGFIIDAAGHILTNYHVVQGAERVDVVLVNGRDYAAEVVGGDPNTDIAVIRIVPRNGEEFPISQIGDSDALRVGDWVLALGNPLGLEFTVTAGIVSAKSRNIRILQNEAGTQLEAFIQTDAAINPGNSGGPMVDLLGRVVGINTAISSQTGFFAGAGFAIPINLARKVAGDLIRHGVVHRPRLGVEIRDVAAPDAEVFNLPSVSGALIVTTPGDIAGRAGLQMGDVIRSVEETPIRNVSELQARVALFSPGDRIRVGYVRYGEAREAAVELGAFEATRENRPTPAARPTSGAGLLGFAVRPTPAEQLRLPGWRSEWTVVIDEVDPNGAAAQQFGPGAALLRINGRDVSSPRDVERLAGALRPGDVVSIVIAATPSPREPPQPRIVNYRVR